MLEQALAEAESHGARQIAELHLELFDPSPETERALRGMVAELVSGTPAERARVVTFLTPSRFICWNCCGLRYEGDSPDALCPNCGELGWLIPVEVTFALDHIEIG
jgi:Zn finger protein HypA/HybF involved in hydrogenase expression